MEITQPFSIKFVLVLYYVVLPNSEQSLQVLGHMQCENHVTCASLIRRRLCEFSPFACTMMAGEIVQFYSAQYHYYFYYYTPKCFRQKFSNDL